MPSRTAAVPLSKIAKAAVLGSPAVGAVRVATASVNMRESYQRADCGSHPLLAWLLQLRLIDDMNTRDDFRQPIIRQIAQRAGYRCSSPACLRPTIGPDGSGDTASIGVAAYITAAAEGGPRYDPGMTSEDRSAAENGIWLCQTCSRLIDVDMPSHPTEHLREWKTLAEMRAYLGLRGFSIAVSRSFERLEKMMPDLVAEMRTDISNSRFTRELIALSKKWSYGGQERPVFNYFYEQHEELLGKLKVMENYGALVDIKFNDVYRYEITEDFVEYLQLPR